MTRSEIASKTDVSIETVLFYEKQGLIPAPARAPNGYRNYNNEYVDRILFIKRAQKLGFSLSEVNDLLDLRVDAAADAGHVRHRAQQKVVEIKAKIKDLQRIQKTLVQLIETCKGHGPTSKCPILNALSQNSEDY